LYSTRKETKHLADAELVAAWKAALEDGNCFDHSGAILEEEMRDRWLKEHGFEIKQKEE